MTKGNGQPEKITCPSCGGSGDEAGAVGIERGAPIPCERCGGLGKVPKEVQATNTIKLPKGATIIPADVAKAGRRKFKVWKQEFINMIKGKSEIEWSRNVKGELVARFILPAELCKIVYEVQIEERIKLQFDYAIKKCQELGVLMPSKKEIEIMALQSLQQEFMQHAAAVIQRQATPLQPDPKAKKKGSVAEDNELTEEEAAASLAKMRADLAAKDFPKEIDTAEGSIKAELAKRDDETK